jgi:hypothetical protein
LAWLAVVFPAAMGVRMYEMCIVHILSVSRAVSLKHQKAVLCVTNQSFCRRARKNIDFIFAIYMSSGHSIENVKATPYN